MIAEGGTPILKVFTARKDTDITPNGGADMSAIPAVIYASVKGRASND
jgi:hypothetical protein